MKHRLSSVAAVTFAAVLSALVMVVHPAQAQTCTSVEVQNDGTTIVVKLSK